MSGARISRGPEMDEAHWLSGVHFGWMLEWVLGGPRWPRQAFATEYKMRSLCQAIAGADAAYGNWSAADYPNDPGQWLIGWVGGTRLQPQEKAAFARASELLREVIGNPFRPVRLAPEEPPNVFEALYVLATERGREPRAEYLPRSVLTPTVVALANAAYSERAKVKCEACEGFGNDEEDSGKRRLSGEPILDSYPCHDCHGTGRIESGTLDNDRLLVLADSLEDAGATNAAILNHMRGLVPCLHQTIRVEPVGEWPNSTSRFSCANCNGTGWITPAEPPVHVRGCHVLDALLGKE